MTTVHAICECELCRLGIRRQVLRAFREEPRWMGFYTIRHVADLGWVPVGLYAEVMADMLNRGLLIHSYGPGDPFARFLRTSLTAPRCRLVRGGRDG